MTKYFENFLQVCRKFYEKITEKVLHKFAVPEKKSTFVPQ